MDIKHNEYIPSNEELDNILHELNHHTMPGLESVDKAKNGGMAMKTLDQVFAFHLGKIPIIDDRLIREFTVFRIRWANKDVNTISFLGSNLLGVHPIRFSVRDEERFYTEVVPVDDNELEYMLHSLPDIDPTRRVSSNVFYLTIVYYMHRAYMSKLNKKKLEIALQEMYYVFAYRAMSSLISHYFKYSVDEDIAKAVYEKLSNKFHIKKYGTWQDVFKYRANDILPGGLHHDRLLKLTNEDATRIVADMQGRLREMVKNIYIILIEVVEKNEKITTTSLNTNDANGEAAIGDVVDRHDVYITYINKIVYNRADFVKDELITVISDILNIQVDRDIYSVLRYITENIMTKNKEIHYVISTIMEMSIDYLSRNNIKSDIKGNIYEVINTLKNYYTGSRVDNKDLTKVKDILGKYYVAATSKRNKTSMSSIRIAIILYIVLRAFSKDTYK